MKLTNQDLQLIPQLGKPLLFVSLEDLARHPVRPRVGFAITRLLRTLRERYEDVEQERLRLLEQHARRDEDGNMLYTNEDNSEIDVGEGYATDYAELMAIEFEIEGLSLSELESVGSISPATLLSLSRLLSDDLGNTQRKKTKLKNSLLQLKANETRPAFVVSLEQLVRKTFPFPVACAIYRATVLVNRQVAQVESARLAIVQKYTKRDEAGEIIYRDESKSHIELSDEAQRAYTELLDATFEVETLNASDLESTENLPPLLLSDLADLFYDDYQVIKDKPVKKKKGR